MDIHNRKTAILKGPFIIDTPLEGFSYKQLPFDNQLRHTIIYRNNTPFYDYLQK